MKSIIAVVALCLVAFATAEDANERITIKAISIQGLDWMLPELIASVDYAFNYASGSDTRSALLLNSLTTLNRDYRWAVVEDAQAFAHTAPWYAYFKVTKGLISHNIKISASM